jgi:DNA-binding transcriptional regulator YiaG
MSKEKEQFVRHLEKLISGAIRQVKQAHGEVLPNSVAKRVASQLWAELSPEAHQDTSAWVRHLRGRLGLSQSEFAKRIGTNQVTIARWETNYSQPSPAYMRVLESEATYIPKSEKSIA